LRDSTPDNAASFVLVVDDSRADLRVIGEALKPLGLSVREATDAYGALAGLYEQEFAVALIDLRMPGIDGFGLAREIRRHPRAAGLPILFVTGSDLTPDEVRRAYALQAVDIVTKPFLPEVLRAKVSVFVELERRRLATELRMELEDLVLATAHDAHEPMRMLNQLLRELHGSLSATDGASLDLMERLRGQTVRADRLMHGLVQFARLRLEPKEIVALDLAEPIAAATSRVADRFEEHGGEIVVDDLPPVRAHPDQIRQLFQELFDNALQFRGSRPLRVRVWAMRVPGEVVVSVEDDGVGIDPERAAHAFELLHPSHSGPDRQMGMGIGLALARRVVHLNGGRIWCERLREDGGTRVSFTLPAAEDEDPGSY
jgi:signal transduction histidine kinase